MKKEEYAFPFKNQHYIHPGLTKREYFAALILQGFQANTELTQWDNPSMVRESITLADLLIRGLEKKND